MRSLKIRKEDCTCFIQLHRPEANNSINAELVHELSEALDDCESTIRIVVLEGLPEIFCAGIDLSEIQNLARPKLNTGAGDPGKLYGLWLRLAFGPYITISHVKGRANAGGLGFIAASDIVLADDTASFSLSELLFGVFPACVLPFLIRRVGLQRAHYLTLMTQPFPVDHAHRIGLVDAHEARSDALLRRHLLRLEPLRKDAIRQYKKYVGTIHDAVRAAQPAAIAANLAAFSDPANVAGMARYAESGLLPWES